MFGYWGVWVLKCLDKEPLWGSCEGVYLNPSNAEDAKYFENHLNPVMFVFIG